MRRKPAPRFAVLLGALSALAVLARAAPAGARGCQETSPTPVLGRGSCYRFGAWDDAPTMQPATALMVGFEPSVHSFDLSTRAFDVSVVQRQVSTVHRLDGPALGLRRLQTFGGRLATEAFRAGPLRVGPFLELGLASLGGVAPWLLQGHAYAPTYAYATSMGFAPSVVLPWGPLLLRGELPLGMSFLVLDTRDAGLTGASASALRPKGLAPRSAAVSGGVGHGPPPDGASAWSFRGLVGARVSVEMFVDRYWTLGAYVSTDLIHRDDVAAGAMIRSYFWPWAGTR